ncbi:MAG: AraC family transcriptional regulator [Bacteroidales bacterium]|nr:AraC family transcriptional regulator [Bacteroidales bacterium]
MTTILPCVLTAVVTFFVVRAYDRRRYESAPAPLAQEPAAVREDAVRTQYEHITEVIRQEKLFLTPGLGRKELVQRFGLTNRQIGALFSEAGTSVPEFIRECRLEYAKNLIAERPDLTFSEIADASGFLHVTTFNVDFKSKYGLTPSQYREQHAQF